MTTATCVILEPCQVLTLSNLFDSPRFFAAPQDGVSETNFIDGRLAGTEAFGNGLDD